jgi:hypothetical protein
MVRSTATSRSLLNARSLDGLAKMDVVPEKRIFQAIVWVGDSPGERLTLEAKDGDEVVEYLRKKYGLDAVFSVWNEEEANRLR